MATKISLEPSPDATAEDRRKTFLIGCASLRFANLLEDADHVFAARGNADAGKSTRQQQKKKQAVDLLSEVYAKRYRGLAGARNCAAALFVMIGWFYIMMLLLSPMYLLMICYLTPRAVQPAQLVHIAEITGNGVVIINTSETVKWQLVVGDLASPATTTYYLGPPDSRKMNCPKDATGSVDSPSARRERRSLSGGRGRAGRDIFQTLRGTYEEAKAKYADVRREVETRASEARGVYDMGVEQMAGRKSRSVGDTRLAPGSYTMFRLTRSATDDGGDGTKERNGPDVAEGRTNALGSGAGEASGREARANVRVGKEGRGYDENGEKSNDVGNEVAFPRVDPDKIGNRADANGVPEEKTDAAVSKPDGSLEVTMVPTVPMGEKETDLKDGTGKKCHASDKNVEGNEITKESVLGDNVEPALHEKGFVQVEEKGGTTAKYEEEKKSEVVKKAASGNLAVGKENAGEVAKGGKALSESPGEKVVQAPLPDGGSAAAAEPGNSDPDIDAKEEEKN